MAALKAAIVAKYPKPDKRGEELDVLVVERIKDCWTYDGIDWNGERVTEEVRHTFRLSDNSRLNFTQVLERVETLESENKKVTKLSITGYSLGGMIARYMIG
jgi:predicted alpha/beta-fold hydrolase